MTAGPWAVARELGCAGGGGVEGGGGGGELAPLFDGV